MTRSHVVLLAAIIVGVALAGWAGSGAPTAQAQTPPDQPDAQASPAAVEPGSAEASRLLRKAEREGSVRAIVGLRTDFVPEGRLSAAASTDQRNGIESAAEGIQAELAGTGYRTLREYETVPYVALRLTPEAFRELQSSPRVTTIQEDVGSPITLAESSHVVQAPTMRANGFNGAGKTIAIIDTGVDSAHPFFGGRVVEEACYSASSHCPNGRTSQTGPGAGVPCTINAEDCTHGTHVAGIAAGEQGPLGFSGVASRANIMSIRVASRATGTDCEGTGKDPCLTNFTSDHIAGLDRVNQVRGLHDIAAVNISSGGGEHSSNCDTDSRKAAIDNLRSAGIATVAASGNDGFTDATIAPACISSAVSVGSTTKNDALANDSNSASFVSLLAPGVDINSSVPGGGFASGFGTSMAAPHVAGAFAVLDQWDSQRSVADKVTLLRNTGTEVTDNRAGGTVTTPRINIADAAGVRPTNDRLASASGLGDTASFSVSGFNGAATRETGEPDHWSGSSTLGENSVWYAWRAPASGRVTFDTCTSSFDTVLAAYSGTTTFPSLAQVASSDDACGTSGRGSRITFDAVGGSTYRIAVSGFLANTRGEGTFTLRADYDLPPNDNFANALPISTFPTGLSGRNVGATREFGEPDHWPPEPTPGENSVWYSWTAPSSGLVNMTLCPPNGQISVLAVYTGGSLGSLVQIASDGRAGTCGWGSGVSFNAVAGTNYKIAVAGYHPHNQFAFTLSLLDPQHPSVIRVVPVENGTGIAPGSNVSAVFSEAMRGSSVTANFKLYRAGPTSPAIAATVTYDPATRRATLNPQTNLQPGTRYRAVVTVGARDQAGNRLDQDPNAAGDQPKVWYFTTRS